MTPEERFTRIKGREAQKHTDEKLNALIDTVDRIFQLPKSGKSNLRMEPEGRGPQKPSRD